MFNRLTLLATGLLLSLSATALTEDGKSRNRPTTTPKDLPVELTIVNRAEEPYELNTRGDRVTKYQEAIRLAESSEALLPASRVNMELEIKNTGSKPLQIWVGGDGTELSLELKGTGPMLAEQKATAEGSVPPEVVTIPAGKSHSIPLTSLEFGSRKQLKRAYLTETGDYRLSATFRTAVTPAPKGSVPVKGTNFGEIQLHSAPIAFRVVRPS